MDACQVGQVDADVLEGGSPVATQTDVGYMKRYSRLETRVTSSPCFRRKIAASTPPKPPPRMSTDFAMGWMATGLSCRQALWGCRGR
jgi:hypothetical protein